jgi:cobalt/nickel transport system permease protein
MCESDIAPVMNPRKRRRSLGRKTADSISHAVSEVLENEDLASRPGLLQRLDPRVKLISLVGFAVVASLVHSVWVLIGLVGLTLALAAASKTSVGSFARKVWGSAGLLAVMLAAPAMTYWITPGPVVVELGPLALTAPGIQGAATLVTRVVASAGFALLIVWTTRWTDILAALTALRIPDVVVATFAMTQKQIVSLLRTVEQIHLARESRTLSPGTAAENRRWVVGRMAFVVQKSVKTADDVYDAMLSRGYTGAMHSITRLHAGIRDLVWLAASAGVCAVSIAIDRVVLPR